MKNSFFPALLALAIPLMPALAKAQANTSLSNLSATAVNTDLSPGTSNSKSLGSSSLGWKDLYLNNLIYMGGARFLTYTSGIGLQNTGLGSFSLAANSTGYNNTGLGAYTLRANTAGYNNVAIGYTSLFKSANGHNNVAIGVASLYSNTSGVSNSAMGNSALTKNTTGNNNMAIGANALGSNTTGYANIGIGVRALFSNQTLNQQVAIGDSALFSITSGPGGNVAIGSTALYNDARGENNSAVGYHALYALTSGGQNTALGNAALFSLGSAYSNTAIGYNALFSSTKGYNTAVGSNALLNLTTGQLNVAVGESSLQNAQSLNGNTAIGNQADVIDGNVSGSSSLGYKSVALTSYQVMLGNSSTSAIRGYADYMNISDGRFKKDVTENVPGLDFILKLRPVTYQLDVQGINGHTAPARKNSSGASPSSYPGEEEAIKQKEKIRYSGFIAQEVESAAEKMHYDFSGVYKPQNDKDLYALSYSSFVVPMVKAVQQLDSAAARKSTVDSLKAEIDSLKRALQEIRDLVRAQINGASSIHDAGIGQNYPNPVKGYTSIPYRLPASYGRAKIMVTDMSGRVVKEIAVNGAGNAVLHLQTNGLSSGSYPYALYVDGQIFGGKQMILVR